MTRDMTEGNSFRHIALFFLPLLASNLFQQLYSAVDSVIVGKGIGDHALAAVGTSGAANWLIVGFLIGITHGFGILFAQSFGAGDHLRLRRQAAMALFAGLVSAGILTVLTLLTIKPLFLLLQVPDELMADALAYFRVILACLCVTLLNNVCLNLLRALGDSRTPLLAMIVSSVFNIFGDLFFVFVLKSGVAGTAVATVLAQALSVLVCLRSLKRVPGLQMEKENWAFRGDLAGELVRMGLPVAFMNSVTALGGFILQYFVNQMGSAAVAAYAASCRIDGLCQQPGISVGLAVMNYTGQNYGAGKKKRIMKGIRAAAILAILVNIPIFILTFIFPRAVAGLMLSEPAALNYAAEYLPVLGVSFFPLGFLFIFRDATQGMGNTFLPMLSGFLELACRFVFGIAFHGFGFRGIAMAEVSAWIGAMIMLGITFFLLYKKMPDDVPG